MDTGVGEDICHIIHTGGSTGAPKAVVCTHAGSLLSHAARAVALPFEAGDVTGVVVFGIWAGAYTRPLPSST